MVDASSEVDFWWLEGVIGWKVYGKEENTARVRAITLLIGLLAQIV